MGCVLGICRTGAVQRLGNRRRSKERSCDLAVNGGSGVRIENNTVADGSLNVSVASVQNDEAVSYSAPVRRRSSPRVGLSEQQEWPQWILAVAGDAIREWKPRRANTFEKIDKIGEGTYSNVYRARDLMTGKVVALKKVRFDDLEQESVKFMVREILVLRKLDHPNVLRLEGLVTSRMSCSLYLIFEYMEHDLSGLAAQPGIKFTLPQIKCYMKQLLSGLEHCHKQGVLHRDIKGSNLLIDNEGNLKLADFGLACFYDSNVKQHMTSRVVTLWYRPPELLLGATHYGTGVDLWSAGCILAELLAERPILPGRTEVEQLHKIFKLCGSPSNAYWKKHKLPNATLFKPLQPYKRCITEVFKDFPPSSLPLLCTLLSPEPDDRGTATAALCSEFFSTKPLPCEPSSLPKYPPSKEMDVKLRDEESRRKKSGGKPNANGGRKARHRERTGRAMPAPEANAELQTNLDKLRLVNPENVKSKSEKFPPPHQDGSVGPVSFGPGDDDTSFTSSIFNSKSPISSRRSTVNLSGRRRPVKNEALTQRVMNAFKPLSIGLSMDFISKKKISF